MWPNPQETVDLVTFTEEFVNGKLHFLCSATKIKKRSETNFWCTFSALSFCKNVSTFFDIKQNVLLNSYLDNWWRHKLNVAS